MAPLKRSGVRGDKELVAALRELGKGPSGAQIDRAAIEAMDPMLQKTRSRWRQMRDFLGKWPGFPPPATPRKGGHVDQGIVVRKTTVAGKGRSYRLGATRRARYLLHLLEFGTAPHWQKFFRGGWMHPGARAHPILLPTFDEEKAAVPERFGRLIWRDMAAKISRLKKLPRPADRS